MKPPKTSLRLQSLSAYWQIFDWSYLFGTTLEVCRWGNRPRAPRSYLCNQFRTSVFTVGKQVNSFPLDYIVSLGVFSASLDVLILFMCSFSGCHHSRVSWSKQKLLCPERFKCTRFCTHLSQNGTVAHAHTSTHLFIFNGAAHESVSIFFNVLNCILP